MVYNVLTNNIIDNDKYKIYDVHTTSKFYNEYFTKVHTINFMNIARATDENDPFKWGDFTSYIFGLFGNLSESSNETSALYMNDKLANFNEINIYNQWIIIDFPTKDAIRKVYTSNKDVSNYITFIQIVLIIFIKYYFLINKIKVLNPFHVFIVN